MTLSHARRAHPKDYHEAAAEADKGRKMWTASEIATLARLDVDLLDHGVPSTINQALFETGAFDGQTQESKGARRKQSHKDLVKVFTEEKSASFMRLLRRAS